MKMFIVGVFVQHNPHIRVAGDNRLPLARESGAGESGEGASGVHTHEVDVVSVFPVGTEVRKAHVTSINI